MSCTVNIDEAEARLAQLVDLAAAGEEVVIVRNGTPVARLVPLQRQPARRVPGSLRGKIWMAPDFDEPDEELIDAVYNGALFPDESR